MCSPHCWDASLYTISFLRKWTTSSFVGSPRSPTMFIRCITVLVTRLPSPICAHVDNVRALGGHNSCIFSGHTAWTLLLAYFIHRHTSSHQFHLLAYCILTSFMIISTRSHYTVDVIVGWIVVYALIKAMDA